MNATAQMKNGEPWDLLADLSTHPEFGMTKAEMEAVLEPTVYIGRCPEQVDRFLASIQNMISDATKADTEINL